MPDPFALFQDWLTEAERTEPNDANAMSLATADAAGRPSLRMVLLKEVDAGGFVFFTNTQSRKGVQLAQNAFAALCFHWKSLRRQVRVEGAVEPVSDAEADAYFATRPRGSQLGAWASRQSRPKEEKWALERNLAVETARFAVGAVPRPPHWSGYRVLPQRIEFWQDRPFRLHERQLFRRPEPGEAPGEGGWVLELLYP